MKPDVLNAPTFEWAGASGSTYRYRVFGLSRKFAPNQFGNYIFARKTMQGEWIPILIGCGDLEQHAHCHPKAEFLRAKGATHFHCHRTASEEARHRETEDLLAQHSGAYEPTGCNDLPAR